MFVLNSESSMLFCVVVLIELSSMDRLSACASASISSSLWFKFITDGIFTVVDMFCARFMDFASNSSFIRYPLWLPFLLEELSLFLSLLLIIKHEYLLVMSMSGPPWVSTPLIESLLPSTEDTASWGNPPGLCYPSALTVDGLCLVKPPVACRMVDRLEALMTALAAWKESLWSWITLLTWPPPEKEGLRLKLPEVVGWLLRAECTCY